MSNISSIFNTTFFLILGIVILAIGLMVIYFESKMREQNHKISSMLSLVSSLAEEINAIKYHLNNFNMVGSGMKQMENVEKSINIPINSSEKITLGENLIEVSDDESDDNEDDDNSEEDTDNENDDEDEDDDSDDNDDDDDQSINDCYDNENERTILDSNNNNRELFMNELKEDDIKILNMTNFNDDSSESDDSDDSSEDNNDIDLIDNFDIEEIESDDDIKEIVEPIVIKKDDLIVKEINEKDIFVNLEKPKNIEVIDYKKLSLNKLKTVVLDKGLATDTSKMKKNDLLKLLGIE